MSSKKGNALPNVFIVKNKGKRGRRYLRKEHGSEGEKSFKLQRRYLLVKLLSVKEGKAFKYKTPMYDYNIE